MHAPQVSMFSPAAASEDMQSHVCTWLRSEEGTRGKQASQGLSRSPCTWLVHILFAGKRAPDGFFEGCQRFNWSCCCQGLKSHDDNVIGIGKAHDRYSISEDDASGVIEMFSISVDHGLIGAPAEMCGLNCSGASSIQ